MLSNLTDKKYSSIHNQKASAYSYKDYINWGKACTTKDGVDIMQGCVTCKDYVVDTLFKETTTFRSSQWTEREHNECCFYISLPNQKYATNFEKNIAQFLNVYEKSHRLKNTIITLATKDHNLLGITYTIKGSQRWMRNATVMSMYLSLIRICACKTNMTGVCFTRDVDDYHCNEMGYWSSLKENYKTLLLKYYENIHNFMKPMPKEYEITGYEKGQVVGHGQCGLFYMFTMIDSYAYNKVEQYARPFIKHIFGKKLWADLNDGVEFVAPKQYKKDEW